MAEPLHILMPSDVFPPVAGGSGWSAHALALALQARGHRVTVIVPRARSTALPWATKERSGPPREAVDVLGVPVVDVPYPSPRIPFMANLYRHEWLWPLVRNVVVREALRVQGAGRRERVVIHAQHVQTAPGAALAGQELGVPVVVTVRDHWPRDYFATGLHGGRLPYPGASAASLATDLVARLGPLRGALAIPAIPYMLAHLRRRRQFLARADAVVAVSRYVARRLPPAIPTERVQVIPNIVDVEAIERLLETPAPLPLEGDFVLFVGKLEHNKGAHLLPTVIQTAREALAGVQPPRLVIAGDGPLAGELEARFAAIGAPLVILPGWTAHDDVPRLMHRADALLFPSAWGEPLSRVLLEASAAGACIAAMPTGGTPEAIEDGVSGVLAPDAPALGRALAALLRDPERRQRLRSGARRIARERFAPDVVAARFEELYLSVTGSQ